MQRKLSEIAEIPKILSSTLATVSETFEKLIPSEVSQKWRKYSYDEDAHDYELSETDEDLQFLQNDGKYTPSLKSSSTGSDYDSEANYDGNELSELENYDNNDNDEDEDYVTEIEIEKLSLYGEDSDNETEQEITLSLPPAEDFLTTSFTWNLRKLPTVVISPESNPATEDDGKDNYIKSSEESRTKLANDKPEKYEKFERAWPWADREKIIYKQSTCHLVPRKPLGLVEKRIQLLAKQQLANKLEQVHATK